METIHGFILEPDDYTILREIAQLLTGDEPLSPDQCHDLGWSMALVLGRAQLMSLTVSRSLKKDPPIIIAPEFD